MLSAALLACALNVHPVTMDAVLRVEHGSPIAINVNHLTGPQPKPTTVLQAIEIARRYIAAGYTVDMGWSQLNSANLPRLGYTIEDAFDECKNIAAGASVLSAFYTIAVQRYGEGQRALMGALSGYNSGSLVAGLSSGYVAKYYINARLAAPAQPLPPHQFPTTVAYDRPGLDLRQNRDE